MFRKILLPTILIILAYGFWASPDLKTISAGVAIFLFGMVAMEEGFRAFTGGTLERLLKRMTDGLGKSLAFGAIATTLMQSSSLVSVITISFLSAELISLAAGIGIIFGANLGTTTGAWLVAAFGLKVKLSAYAMPILVFGVILIFQRSRTLRGIGNILTGIGFLFLGIHYMKEGFDAFKQGIDLAAYAVAGYPGVILFVGIGILATVIMQSSHATLVLVITALAAEQVTYENALALAIGSNVGTTITAILGSIGANVQGRRLAGAHLIFNVTTGAIAIATIYQFVVAVDWLADFLGIAPEDYTLKLAIFHTLFNVLGVMLMTPFIGKLVSFLERTMRQSEVAFEQPKYLNDASTEVADAAIEAARKETSRLYDKAVELIVHGIGLRRRDVFSEKDDADVRREGGEFEEHLQDLYERSVKSIYGAILEFVSEAQVGMASENAEQLYAIRLAGRELVEAVKAVEQLQKNLKPGVGSQNEDIRASYEAIRDRIVRVLREVDTVRLESIEDSEGLTILSLNEAKATLRREEIGIDARLDELVRHNRITATEATSLVNDYRYSYRICKRLVKLGQTIFASHDPAMRALEESLALNEEEMDAISEAEEGVLK